MSQENEKFPATPESQEVELNPEQKMERVAQNMIDSFKFNPKKEMFILVTDSGVIEENGALVEALENELKKRTVEIERGRGKGNYKILVAPESETSAVPFGKEVGRHMKDSPVLILTSMSRSHSPETGAVARGDIAEKENFIRILEAMSGKGTKFGSGRDPQDLLSEDEYYERLKEIAEKRRSRIISCTKGKNPFNILTQGAVEERPEVLKERGEKVQELMKEVQKVHITTNNGTDITLRPRTDKEEVETCEVSRPGVVYNYPMGEWSCSPWWKGANGTLVVDGPFGGRNQETGRWHNLDWVKEAGPFKLTIKEGEIVEINGRTVNEQRSNPDTDLIASFIAYLDSGNNEQNQGYKLAEFAVGTNSMACKNKPDEYWGSTETEKKLGTCHIAVGSNGSFGVEKDDPNYNAATIHCDMVILDPELTVECTKKDGEKFNLIEKGQPQGY